MDFEVRSPAAQAGYVDAERVIFDCAGAFARAKTIDDLDRMWEERVKPVSDQLSDASLGILESLHSLNLALVMRGLR